MTVHRHSPFLLAGLLAAGIACAQPAKPSACPYTPDELAKVLGSRFQPGKVDSSALGTWCKYDGDRFSVGVGQVPLSGAPSGDMLRKMMNPGQTRWTPLPNDPDKAAVMIQAPDVGRFPAIAYDRGGQMVQLQITGQFSPDPGSKDATAKAADALAAKLATLRRLP